MFPEKINVAITHWKTSDGNVFTDQSAAKIHQAVIDGDARICPKCNGTGMVDPYGDGRTEFSCRECTGGYQFKNETWK